MLWSYSLVAAVTDPPVDEAGNLNSALSQVEEHIYCSMYRLISFKPWNKKLL